MIKKFIARILKKPLYKSKVIIKNEDFTAEHNSNSIIDALKWTLYGIHEANATQPNSKQITGGIYGQICEFNVILFTKNSIGVCCYTKPKPKDALFMTNNMVYIPENILKIAKKNKVCASEFIR